MPLFLDNYKPNTGGGARDLINLIHNILEGSEKDRLDRNAELRPAKSIHTWPVITGEDLPDNDPATLARLLVVRFEDLPADASKLLTYVQQHARHLNAVGRVWLDFLESETDRAIIQRKADRFQRFRGVYMNCLHRVRRDTINVRRVATNLATNHATWFILCEHPEIGPVLQPYQNAYEKGLILVLETMSNETAETLAATVYINTIRELVASERSIIATDRSLKGS